MNRFVIAFWDEAKGTRQLEIQSATAELALRSFFEQMDLEYTKNSEGFAWFKEDFYDEKAPQGSILNLE